MAALSQIISKSPIILMRINYSCSKQSPTSFIFTDHIVCCRKKRAVANPLKATTTQTGNKKKCKVVKIPYILSFGSQQ